MMYGMMAASPMATQVYGQNRTSAQVRKAVDGAMFSRSRGLGGKTRKGGRSKPP